MPMSDNPYEAPQDANEQPLPSQGLPRSVYVMAAISFALVTLGVWFLVSLGVMFFLARFVDERTWVGPLTGLAVLVGGPLLGAWTFWEWLRQARRKLKG
jgi:hypothetical protein